MKSLPYLNEISRNVVSIDTFAGLNKRFRISENEFSESYNMTSEDYPALSTRRKRKILKSEQSDNGILSVVGGASSVVVSNGIIAVLTRSGDLYYGENKLSLDITDNKLLRVGNMLYAYPSGILIKLPSADEDEITVEKTVKSLKFTTDDSYIISFYPAMLSASDGRMSYLIKPSEPNVGDYFWSSTNGLEMYGDTGSGEYGWVGVEADGIMVQACKYVDDGAVYYDFSADFKANDAIFISAFTDADGENISDYNGSYIIDSFGRDASGNNAMFLIGGGDKFASGLTCIFEKKMPYGLDLVISHNNRLWGCFYGHDDDGNFLNEIYATALNDPTNWYRYDGTIAQSYTMSVVSDGKFTGAGVINGYPTFFKENCMHRIYGDSPSDFQLATFDCVGVQEGCEDSFAGYNGVYYYKSNLGIMRISDGYPVKISDVLGVDNYTDAVGGTDGSFYYVSMKNDGAAEMFVYDISRDLWHCEDAPDNIKQFFKYKNMLFAVTDAISDASKSTVDELYEKYITAENKFNKLAYKIQWTFAKALAVYNTSIISFARNDEIDLVFPAIDSEKVLQLYSEDEVRWSFETGNIGYSYYCTKYIKKMCVRLQADVYARADVEILYDSEGEWISAYSLSGDSTVKTYNIEIRPQRCDHFKMRFGGFGDVKILGVTIFFSEGSELQ